MMRLKKIKFMLIFLIFTTSLLCPVAGESKSSFSKHLANPKQISHSGGDLFHPKLYLVDDDTVEQVNTNKYLPQRIYAVYLKDKKTWFFTLTNKRGKLTHPLEIIYFNTVIPGKFLGSKNPYQYYRFTRHWKWKHTKRREEYFYWVLSKPQVFKRIMFFDPPVERKK